jgi:hypothetical protein
MSGVKAGDLAIIKCNSARHNGRIVEVLYAAPHGSFQMPDGYPASTKGCPDACWVIKFIGGPAPARFADGIERLKPYAIAPDWCLYPLPGDPESIDERESDEVSA